MFAKDAAKGGGNFADRGEILCGVENGRHEIAAGTGRFFQPAESAVDSGLGTGGAEIAKAFDLLPLDFRVDFEYRRLFGLGGGELVDANDDLRA